MLFVLIFHIFHMYLNDLFQLFSCNPPAPFWPLCFYDYYNCYLQSVCQFVNAISFFFNFLLIFGGQFLATLTHRCRCHSVAVDVAAGVAASSHAPLCIIRHWQNKLCFASVAFFCHAH